MNQFSDKLKLAAVVGGSVIVGGVLWKLIRKASAEKLPQRWRKTGEVSDLLCYPIKSGGWIRLDDFECLVVGPRKDNLRDRVFMVVNTNMEFVTARKYPNLIQIKPELNGDIMKLSAQNMDDIEISFEDLNKKNTSDAKVWDQPVKVIDAGDEVAQWLSRFILQEDVGLRLVFYPSFVPTRDVRPKNKIFETAFRKDTGALHDATSYMLINESSVEELNTRIETPVTPLRFRPNIVVKGPAPYDEDKWKYIKIGDVIFQNVKPCTRCIFTNIDPETAERSPKGEPLATLKTYRTFEKSGESPVMGIHLGVRQQGTIKMNDAIYVDDD